MFKASNLGVGGPPKPRSMPPPPFGKPKDGMDIAVVVGGPKKPMPGGEESPNHEATETPDQEGAEDYGSKLMADIEAVGKNYGADAETSKQIAADMFDAMAKCLRGGGEEGSMGATPEEPAA